MTVLFISNCKMTSSMSVTDELIIAFLSIWEIISVAGNVSVIACIWKASTDNRKHTGRTCSLTSTDILIVSLAVNDILLAGVVLPQKMHGISHTDHFYERKSQVFTVNFIVKFVNFNKVDTRNTRRKNILFKIANKSTCVTSTAEITYRRIFAKKQCSI